MQNCPADRNGGVGAAKLCNEHYRDFRVGRMEGDNGGGMGGVVGGLGHGMVMRRERAGEMACEEDGMGMGEGGVVVEFRGRLRRVS